MKITEEIKKRPAVWVKVLWAAGVLGLALALRLIYVAAFHAHVPYSPYFFPPRTPHQPSEGEALLSGASLSDSHAYEKLAANLLDHGTYTWQESPPYIPTAYIPPGYPLFIAAIYGFSGRNPWNVIAVQLILSLFMIGLIFFWSERRWGLKVAVPASLLLAFDPVSVVFSGALMGETLGAALLLAAMLLYLETFEDQRWWKIFLSALLLGLTALVRAATLYFVIPLLLPLFLHRDIRFSKGLLLSLILMGGFILPVAGWMLRNRIATGKFHFAGITGYNMLYTNAGSLLAWQEHISLTQARELIAKRYASELEPLIGDLVALSSKDTEIAKRMILAYPLRYAILHATGGITTLIATRSEDLAGLIFEKEQKSSSFFRTLFSAGPRAAFELLCQRGWVTLLSLFEVLLLLACYVLFIIGVFRSRWRPDWLTVFLTVAYTAVLVGPVADSRFRIAFIPLICIFTVRSVLSLKTRG